MTVMLAAIPLLCAAEPRQRVPDKLTLNEAMEIAFRSSTVLARASAQVKQAEAQSMQARSSLLPQVGVAVTDAGQTVNLRAMGIDIPLPGFSPRVGPFQTVDARANAGVNLFNVPLWKRERAAREQVLAVSSSSANARELLALQVAVAFAQAYRAQSAVATLERQVNLARKLHEVTTQRFDLGAASRLETRRSLQQVQSLDQTLIESRHTLVTAKLQLAHVLHAEAGSDFVLEESRAGEGRSWAPEEALRVAVKGRPEMRMMEAQIRAGELRVEAARAQRLPTVSVNAGYGQSGRSWTDNLNTFRVQGSINIPIYTGRRIEAETAEAQARVDELKAQREELSSQIDTEVLSALSALDAARKQLAVARESAALAAEEVELSTERFRLGVADNTEVTLAQERLTRAEDNAVRAAYQADLATAQVYRALGTAEQFYRRGNQR
jgi:outer membrane protein TolC